jgi:hypothetical protein
MQIVNPVAERKWTFKSTLDDDKVLERAADSFAKRGITSVALLYDSSGFGQSAKEQMEKVAPKRGLKVIYETVQPGRHRSDRATLPHQGPATPRPSSAGPLHRRASCSSSRRNSSASPTA